MTTPDLAGAEFSAPSWSTWLAAADYPHLAPGETAVLAHVAPDRKQAGIDLDYSSGIVMGSELLRAELANATQSELVFKHRTQLEAATASYRTVRGRTLAGAWKATVPSSSTLDSISGAPCCGGWHQRNAVIPHLASRPRARSVAGLIPIAVPPVHEV